MSRDYRDKPGGHGRKRKGGKSCQCCPVLDDPSLRRSRYEQIRRAVRDQLTERY